MIDAYVWTTPNGFKALIALEELGLPYTTKWIDITKGQQTTPEYLAINPNNKIPAITDPDGPDGKPITIFESGAIMTYLGDKTKKLLPQSGAARYTTLEWLFWGAAGIGPMGGQFGYWGHFAKEKNPPAIERYKTEVDRLLRVADTRLASSKFLGGDEFTIADINSFTYARGVPRFGIDMSPYPNVTRWVQSIDARPAVQRALAMKPPGA
jgi:GSH-dependent disulfide-bond oxidoreductase